MSKTDEVYKHIMDRLISAHYGFGEQLYVKELSQDTKASRQPIMSALNRLSTEGFVRIVPQVGCEIVHPTKSEIADFFLLFENLEGLLARMAAERRTEDHLLELNIVQQRLLSVTRRESPSPSQYVELNRTFHATMHMMAHSPLLMTKQRNNFNMCDFFITHSVGFESFMFDAVKDHNEVIAAIADKDAARAEKESRKHIADIGRVVVAGLKEDVLVQ